MVQHSSRPGGRGNRKRRRRRRARVQAVPADGSAREQLVEGQRLPVELQLLFAQRRRQSGLGQAEALAAMHLLIPEWSPQPDATNTCYLGGMDLRIHAIQARKVSYKLAIISAAYTTFMH